MVDLIATKKLERILDTAMTLHHNGLEDFFCPNCKSKNIAFSEVREGYGYGPYKVLLACRECLCVFCVNIPEDKNGNGHSESNDED
ncbi:MAG TPA: hypothetical protein ACFYD3_06460 [Candidatus Hypogeohydataceae bacterium YC41]